MNHNNSFIKQCIVQSLLELMQEKEFKSITITEITKKAGVSRMAYYRNYYYKEDILDNYMTELLEKYSKIRNRIARENNNDKYSIMLYAFEYFKENESFVVRLEESNLSNIIQNRITSYIQEIYKVNDTNSKYDAVIFSGAFYNTGKFWLMDGKKESLEELTRIFVSKMFPNTKEDI